MKTPPGLSTRETWRWGSGQVGVGSHEVRRGEAGWDMVGWRWDGLGRSETGQDEGGRMVQVESECHRLSEKARAVLRTSFAAQYRVERRLAVGARQKSGR